ncbi:reverse transcriptase domain-containing protein, partial [Bradyrhizobium sp. 143]|uniref:reverse transcriptase domain-containing protein n=1 Tax=Bradyrhizobium sp. 143 TaxID=2782619 RepID=UPI001FF92383
LSPLLANVLLDEVDKALERRGHCFVRYADDANVYVRSRRAGERVMALLRRLYGKLHLTVNETKSAVASVFGRKFLGYSFWVAPGGVIKRKVAVKPLMTFKQRIRQLTCRSGGRVWRELDQWVRHRLRAIQLKQWKRGTTMYRELLVLGAKLDVARQVAANSRRWWRNSGMLLNAVLTLNWSDRLGLPRLS